MCIDIVATLDGSIGFLQPVTEKTYRRLLMLQNALNGNLPHTAGLNPKSFRSVVSLDYEQLPSAAKFLLANTCTFRMVAVDFT